MALSSKKVLLLLALESIYGTAVALTGADAFQTKDLAIKPFEGEAIDRALDSNVYGASQRIHVGQYVEVTWKCELVGSGTLGTAPAFGKALRAASWTETVSAGVSVEYTPNSFSTTSATLAFNLDGIHHLVVGARGTTKIMLDANAQPYIEFRFIGIYASPTAVAAPTPTGWSAFQVAQPLSFGNTSVFQFYGVTSGWQLRKLEIDLGVDVQYYEGPGEQLAEGNEREVTGSIETLLRTVGAFNPFTQASNNATGALLLTHGTTAATRWHLSAPAVQLLKPGYGNDRNRATMTADLVFIPTSAGDDEIKLRFASAAS